MFLCLFCHDVRRVDDNSSDQLFNTIILNSRFALQHISPLTDNSVICCAVGFAADLTVSIFHECICTLLVDYCEYLL